VTGIKNALLSLKCLFLLNCNFLQFFLSVLTDKNLKNSDFTKVHFKNSFVNIYIDTRLPPCFSVGCNSLLKFFQTLYIHSVHSTYFHVENKILHFHTTVFLTTFSKSTAVTENVESYNAPNLQSMAQDSPVFRLDEIGKKKKIW
jgi:hypothetical protein